MGGILEHAEVRQLLQDHPRSLVLDAVRVAVGEVRDSGQSAAPAEIAKRAGLHLRLASRRSLRPVFNATGLVALELQHHRARLQQYRHRHADACGQRFIEFIRHAAADVVGLEGRK